MAVSETGDFQRFPRRSAEEVMRLERLGSQHQCRLSFMRQLTRRMAAENWQFSRPVFELDEHGVGHAVYVANYPGGQASLVAFAHELPDELRSDRVIAEQWDTTFTLFHGVPTEDDIQRLKDNVPLQEAGRVSESELTLSRANRSVRLWEYVVGELAEGRQPEADALRAVGYLMRTTAVYGSGKFGSADREQLAAMESHANTFRPPFSVEMLTVYLIRAFVKDLVNHEAAGRGGETAIRLDPELARELGIGNSTGLGMAPFLINHPVLINNWVAAREEAISRVRSIRSVESNDIANVLELLRKTRKLTQHWKSDHAVQQKKLVQLTQDLTALENRLANAATDTPFFWNAITEWCCDNASVEGQECMASLMLEPYGELIDDLSLCMDDPAEDIVCIDGTRSIGEVIDLIENSFGWANAIDWTTREATARCWYVSEEKLEPRLGERYDEPLEDYEQPLVPSRDAILALKAMSDWGREQRVAEFLVAHPEHRRAVRRAQLSLAAPYGEIRDNTIDANMLPIDLLRAKLAFFGATRFDPRSDRWVRICLYPGAPYPDELDTGNSDQWIYPGH